ncbi:MAG: hypothetical protein ACKVHO_19790, partial [Verrucomicrobiia bacterium]
PDIEFFDLSKDPLELNNLADKPEHQAQLKSMRNELDTWVKSQEDDLLPHRDPYLRSQPIPIIKPTPKRKRK